MQTLSIPGFAGLYVPDVSPSKLSSALLLDQLRDFALFDLHFSVARSGTCMCQFDLCLHFAEQ